MVERIRVLVLLLLLAPASAWAQSESPLRENERIRFATTAGWVQARYLGLTSDTLRVALRGGHARAVALDSLRGLQVQRVPVSSEKVHPAEAIFYLPMAAIAGSAVPLTGLAGGGTTGFGLGTTVGYLAGGTGGIQTGATIGAGALGLVGIAGAVYWTVRNMQTDEWSTVRLSGRGSALSLAPPPRAPYRDPGAARLAALIVPGGGHLYAGEQFKGWALASLAVAAPLTGGMLSPTDEEGLILWSEAEPLVAGAVVSLIVWAYGVADADDSAARVNSRNGFTEVAAVQVRPVYGLRSDGTVSFGVAVAF